VEVAKPLKKSPGKGRRNGGGRDRDRARFAEYLPAYEVREMLKKGLLCQGAIRVNPHKYDSVVSFFSLCKFFVVVTRLMQLFPTLLMMSSSLLYLRKIARSRAT
jgi:hypothetical protein